MEAKNRLLPDWFARIRTGQLRLPRFQRFEEWGHAETSGLLESVLWGLPAGAALVLDVGDREKFVSRPVQGAPEPAERVNEHLLDGQQRLTALWRALHNQYHNRKYFAYFTGEDDEEPGAPAVDGQGRWERKGKLYPIWADDPVQTYRRGYIPLSLLRPGDIAREIGAWCDAAVDGDVEVSRELERKVNRLKEKITTYNLPYLSLPVTTPRDVAIDVFIKLNTNSVPLTAFDIVVTQVEAKTGQSLHQLVGDLRSEVPALQHYTDPEDLILSAAAMREDRPPTQKSFQLLDYGRLVDEWDVLVDGARFLVECPETERIFDATRLPTVAVLPVITALFEFVPSALDARGNAHVLMRRYLWRAFLTRRYENTAATRALQDLRGLREALVQGNDPVDAPIFDSEDYPAPTPEELVRASWPKKRDSLARGILALTIKNGALDLADGSRADRANLPTREYHHLFPAHLLTSDDHGAMSDAESSRALNCVVISWNTNRTISAKEPVAYLKERAARSVLGEEQIRSRLQSHLVPFESLAVGDFETTPRGDERQRVIRSAYRKFLRERAVLLQGPIQALLDGRDWPPPS